MIGAPLTMTDGPVVHASEAQTRQLEWYVECRNGGFCKREFVAATPFVGQSAWQLRIKIVLESTAHGWSCDRLIEA